MGPWINKEKDFIVIILLFKIKLNGFIRKAIKRKTIRNKNKKFKS